MFVLGQRRAGAAFEDTWLWCLLAIDLCLHGLDLFLQIAVLLLVEISASGREGREQGEETLNIVSQFAKLFEDGPRQQIGIGVQLLFQPKKRGRDRRKDAHCFQYDLLVLRQVGQSLLAGFKSFLHN